MSSKITRSISTAEKALLVLGTLGVTFLALKSQVGPIYLSDEIGYAAKAAQLGGLPNLLASSWHAGYPALLAPIFRVFGITDASWRAIRGIHVLMTACSVACWISTLKAIGIDKKRAVLLGLSTLLPFASWAFTSWIFTNPTMQLLIALISRLLTLPNGAVRTAGLSLVSGFSYWVHPTGAILCLTCWSSAILRDLIQKQDKNDRVGSTPSLWRRVRRAAGATRFGLIGIAATIAGVISYGTIHRIVNDWMGGNQGHYESQIAGYVSHLLSDPGGTILSFGTAFINGLANLSIATYGYGLLCLFLLIPNSSTEGALAFPSDKTATQGKQWKRWRANQYALVMFVGFSALGLLLFSAMLAIGMGYDYQHLFHQRYSAIIIQSVWVIGFSNALRNESRSNLGWRLSLVCAPIILAILLGVTLWKYDNRFSVIDGMPSATSLLANQFASEWQAIASLLIGFVVVFFAQSFALRPKLAFCFMVSVMAATRMNEHRQSFLNGYSSKPKLVEYIQANAEHLSTCLAAYDTPGSSSESSNKYELYMAGEAIKRIASRSQQFDLRLRDPRHCDRILTPLDAARSSERVDIQMTTRALQHCAIEAIDLDHQWGLYTCGNHKRGLSSAITLLSSQLGNQRHFASRSILDFAEQSQSSLSYAGSFRANFMSQNHLLARIRNSRKEEFFRNKLAAKFRTVCYDQRKLFKIKSSLSSDLIAYGFYRHLKTGDYTMLLPGLDVVQGSAITEVMINRGAIRIASREISGCKVNSLRFRLDQPMEVEARIHARNNTVLSLPDTVLIYKLDSKHSSP